ncbi:MAG: hypothetical protein JSV17_01675 [Candidatus Aminicenantes bacterium]|nr:MAG: hypothetical protein JSV17_01675 [Candidatus Aminicenantes bacterium]
MKSISVIFLVIFGILSAFLFSDTPKLTENDFEDDIAQIFKQSCSTSGCHQGRFPPMNLNLERDKFKASLVNVASQELPHLKLVDTGDSAKSYLLMKIRGNKAISGKQMPLDGPPLQEKDIQAIETWILHLKTGDSTKIDTDETGKGVEDTEIAKRKIETKPAFWGTRLVNLPTTQTIDKGKVLFRISHRYFPAVSDGYDDFYGLDGPAVILLSLGYGINDRLSISLARSNRFKEVELSFKWLVLEQREIPAIPVSAALNVGGGLITDIEAGEKTFQSKNIKFNAQLSISHRFSNAFSLVLVPAYSSNTNHWESSSQGTLSLGVGAKYMFPKDFSLIAEWIPVLAGFRAESSGWGIGIEKKIGGHVFQVFVTNSIGMTSSQFVPGGAFKLQDGDFRFGFNIFRLF